MKIEEESLRRIFRNCGIDMAWRSWRASLLKLKESAEIGIYTKTQSLIVVSDLQTIETETGFIKKKREDYRPNSRLYQRFF